MEPLPKTGSTYNNNIRRVFHFLSISLVSLVYGLGPWVWETTLPVLGIIALSFIGLDLLRLHFSTLNGWVESKFKFLMRKHELHELSGTSWFFLGAVISLALFPKAVSVFGFLCLAAGDPIASYVGISATQGQKIGQKTWAGCWAFFLISWLVGGLWLLQAYPPLLAFSAAAVGGFGAALMERALNNVDDNLVVPLVASGLAMAFFNLLPLYGIATP